MDRERTIDVCVATYRRPRSLALLLKSLARQKREGIRMKIIVADNDAAGSARAVVESFTKETGLELVYDVEPVQGISYARNRALQRVGADYFAFLDDDEEASEDWLKTLLEALDRHGADAVFGRVLRTVPPNAPAWTRSHYLIQLPRYQTGTRVEVGPTNNVLVRTAALGRPPLRFDPAFALTGGEDSDFFYRLFLSGCRLIRCDEAVVFDPWPLERLQLGWICRRGYRMGQSFARVFVGRYSGPRRKAWLLQCLLLLGAGAMTLPFVFVFYWPKSVELLTRLFYLAGKLSYFFGEKMYFQEYAAGSGKTS